MKSRKRQLLLIVIAAIAVYGFLALQMNESLSGWNTPHTEEEYVFSHLSENTSILILTQKKAETEKLLKPFHSLTLSSVDSKGEIFLLTYVGNFPSESGSISTLQEVESKVKGIAQVSGVPAIEYGELNQIKTQTEVSDLGSSIFLLPVMILLFGAFFVSVIPLSVALLTVGIVYFILYIVHFLSPVSILAATTANTIALSTNVDYPLGMIHTYRETESMKEVFSLLKEVILKAGIALVLTSIPLIFIDQKVVRSMGLAVCITAVVSVILNSTVTPFLIYANRSRILETKNKLPFKVTRIRSHKVGWIFIGVLVVLSLPISILRIGNPQNPVKNTENLSIPLLNQTEPAGKIQITTEEISRIFPQESLFPIVVIGDAKEEVSLAKEFHGKINKGVVYIPTTIPAMEQSRMIQKIQESFPNVEIGGAGETIIDFNKRLGNSLPWLIPLELVVIPFLLSLVLFKKFHLALLTVLLKLLPLGAAFGIMIIGSKITGYNVYNIVDPIIAIPVYVGFATYYHILIINDMRKRKKRGEADFIQNSIKRTSLPVMGGAFAMFTVLSGFSIVSMNASIIQLAELLALAFLIEAFIARTIVLPSFVRKYNMI